MSMLLFLAEAVTTTPTFDLGHGVLGAVIAVLCWIAAMGKGAAEFAKKEVQAGQDKLEALHTTGHELLTSANDQIAGFQQAIAALTAEIAQLRAQQVQPPAAAPAVPPVVTPAVPPQTT